MQVQSVLGSIPGTGSGLGPTFNGESCAQCHAQPSTGGTSPFTNPQIGAASAEGATNQVPFFITPNGPVREARFPLTPDLRQRDGGVHDLFTIAGRSDAAGCNLAQPDFLQAAKNGNLIFRIPTTVFGAGLIELIPDSTIRSNLSSNSARKRNLGISGRPNTNGNDGTITRFGWKAQNKSLEIFSGEAYNVEMGPRSASAGSGHDLHATRTSNISLHWMCAMPHPISDYRTILRGRAQQHSGEPLFRPGPAPHGAASCRQRQPGICRRRRVPHRAALGIGPANLLHARWPNFRLGQGHPFSLEHPEYPVPRLRG